VGEVENIRMVAEEEEVAGSRSRLVEGEVRSSVVGSSLAGVGTAVVGLRILRGIQLLDILTYLCVRAVDASRGEICNC
jgi:hypothetical protein